MTLPFLRCQAAIILYISKPIKPWSSVSDYSFALNRRRTLFRNQTAIFLHSETKYNHNEVIWVIKFCNQHKTHLQSVSVHWCFKDTPWNLTKYKNISTSFWRGSNDITFNVVALILLQPAISRFLSHIANIDKHEETIDFIRTKTHLFLLKHDSVRRHEKQTP